MSEPVVYLVEDDASLLDATGLFLRVNGHAVRTFPCAEHCLEAYRDDWFGCVLTDMKMGAMSGLELVRALAERGATIPVVVVTAFGDVPAARAALKGGAHDFLEKPVDNTVLLEVVAEAIATHRGSRALAAQVSRRREKLERLTERERQVMELVRAGVSHRDIATKLGISSRTVEVYKSRLMEKLQARTVADLVRLAGKAGAEPQ